MTFTPNETVQLFVCIQSFMFAFILLTDRGKKQNANRFLAAFLLMLSSQMAFILLEKWVGDYEPYIGYLCLFGFAYGPLLYGYSLQLIHRDLVLNKQQWLHALPLIIVLISGFLGFPLCYRFGSLLYISLLIYVVLSIRQIIQYRKVVRNTRSAIDRINLKWLQWTLIVFTITLLTDIYSHFYEEIEPIPGVSVVSITLLVLVNGIFYKGVRQPQVFEGISQSDRDLVTEKKVESGEYEKEAKALASFFEQEQAYTNPDLTLAELAAMLELTPRRLSEVINRHFGQNFMDFINTHRIDFAKQRLLKPEDPKETISEVMYASGFNSKSSFNTLFKQKTGKTPSEFKRSQSR